MRIVALPVLLLALASASAGTIFYASPSGSGANPGTRSSPFDLPTLLNKGQNNNSNTLVLLSGKYAGNFQANNISNCTIKADVPYGAIIADGTGANANLDLEGASGVFLSFLVFSNAQASEGLALGSGNWNDTVDHCVMVSNHLTGLLIGGKGSSNMVAQFCLAHGNGTSPVQDHGIYIEGLSAIVRGCVARYNAAWGIQNFSGFTNSTVTGSQIYENLTYSNGNEGLVLWACDGQVANANSTNGTAPGQIGTNSVFSNTFLDGISVRFGQLWATNNLFLPNRSHGDTLGIINQGGGLACTILGDYNAGTNIVLGSSHELVTSWSSLAFVSPSTGLFWLGSSSSMRGAAFSTISPPVDFFGAPQASISDLGAFQYSAAAAGDTRVLDPWAISSGTYWTAPSFISSPFTSTR